MTVTVEPHVARAWIERVTEASRERTRDEIAVEEPLEIRVDGDALAVAMRTPGEDEELAAGFLAGEGLIGGRDEIASIGPTEDLAANVVEVRTRGGLRRDPSGERRFSLTSSCGVCGKAALEFVRQESPPAVPAETPVEPELVLALPEATRRNQSGYARTGGLHATGLFDPADGRLLCLREDVGRHNAMDKSIGAMLLEGRYPLTGVLGCLSGRAGFELVQKASLAGMLGLVAVGAPTTLAVDLAHERDMLLCGFVRGNSFNVYAGLGQLSLPEKA
ncbi:MAG TPA: formate dehydrogenase accessory sulfurtransferase FdhD [Thermoleophilaceae bacterium]|nr:formate dehydrogenase accessory sulfurtransferase FdhD [Thermoleophilaceae bacterium]